MKQNTASRIWKSPLVIAALLWSFVGLSCFVAGYSIVFGCFWWTCTKSQPFISQEVELPREFFPANSAYGHLSADTETEGAKQRESQTIFWGDGNGSTAGLTVASYPSKIGAKHRFDLEVKIYGHHQGNTWEKPPDFTYQSGSADQFFVVCGYLAGKRCVFAGRYDEYLITLSMNIDKQMTMQDFQRIVIYLNDVVAERLKRY